MTGACRSRIDSKVGGHTLYLRQSDASFSRVSIAPTLDGGRMGPRCSLGFGNVDRVRNGMEPKDDSVARPKLATASAVTVDYDTWR